MKIWHLTIKKLCKTSGNCEALTLSPLILCPSLESRMLASLAGYVAVSTEGNQLWEVFVGVGMKRSILILNGLLGMN